MDTRFGKTIYHNLDSLCIKILKHWVNPRSLAQLSLELNLPLDNKLKEVISDLNERNLLFLGGYLYLSLVLENDDPNKREVNDEVFCSYLKIPKDKKAILPYIAVVCRCLDSPFTYL